MNRAGMALAVALLLAVNAFVLAGVAYNRQGDPEASVLLTERELPLAYNYYQSRENTGLALHLNWQNYEQDHDWFDAAKLAELGMTATLPDSPDRKSRYRRALPIKAYVVFEYEGASWARYQADKQAEIAGLPQQVAEGRLLQEAAERRAKEIATALRLAPRLFAVDVGEDPQKLRQRYPDRSRFLILLAKVRSVTTYESTTSNGNKVRKMRGRIDSVLTDTIHVPKRLARIFDGLSNEERIYPGSYYYNAESKQRVHYQVRMNCGRRYEPWIAGIALLDTGESYQN